MGYDLVDVDRGHREMSLACLTVEAIFTLGFFTTLARYSILAFVFFALVTISIVACFAMAQPAKGRRHYGLDLLMVVLCIFTSIPLAHEILAFRFERSLSAVESAHGACLAHRAKTGTWPRQLKDLVPGGLAAVPRDGWDKELSYWTDGKRVGYSFRVPYNSKHDAGHYSFDGTLWHGDRGKASADRPRTPDFLDCD